MTNQTANPLAISFVRFKGQSKIQFYSSGEHFAKQMPSAMIKQFRRANVCVYWLSAWFRILLILISFCVDGSLEQSFAKLRANYFWFKFLIQRWILYARRISFSRSLEYEIIPLLLNALLRSSHVRSGLADCEECMMTWFSHSENTSYCWEKRSVHSVTYLSHESRRGISSLGVKLGRWFKSRASRLRGCEPPMLEVLSLPLLAECSLERSLLTGPESETRRSVTEEDQYEKS